MTEKTWAKTGKVLVGALGALASLIVIVTFLSTDEANLLVQVQHSPLPWPPGLEVAPARLQEFEGVWLLSIINVGERTATSVSVKLPGATLFQLEREADSPTTGSIEEVLEVGDLRPSEKVSITAWTRTAEFYRPPEIRVTHDEGSFQTRPQAVVNSFGYWLLYDWKYYFYLLAFWILVSAIVEPTIKQIWKPKA